MSDKILIEKIMRKVALHEVKFVLVFANECRVFEVKWTIQHTKIDEVAQTWNVCQIT